MLNGLKTRLNTHRGDWFYEHFTPFANRSSGCRDKYSESFVERRFRTS